MASITDRNQLVIATWNARGLFRDKLELEVFLEDRGISVMMISETLLKKGRLISFPGFQVFKKDIGTRGGGVAVLVRNELQARQIDVHSVLEVVGIEVEIEGSRYRFISAYIPPRRIVTEDEVRRIQLEE